MTRGTVPSFTQPMKTFLKTRHRLSRLRALWAFDGPTSSLRTLRLAPDESRRAARPTLSWLTFVSTPAKYSRSSRFTRSSVTMADTIQDTK